MRVRVLYFGVLKDVFGCEGEELTLPEGSVADAVLAALELRRQVSGPVRRSLAVAVNREYVKGTALLCEGDEVALLPPVSGGCDAG